MTRHISIEPIGPDTPNPGYEVSIEANNWSERGWWGHTPEVALARMLIEQTRSTQNLAQSAAQHAENQAVIVAALLEQLGQQLPEHEKPAYTTGSTVSQAEVDRLRGQLWSLQQSEVGRLYEALKDARRELARLHGKAFIDDTKPAPELTLRRPDFTRLFAKIDAALSEDGNGAHR